MNAKNYAPIKFSIRLCECVKNSGMTQKQVAERIGVERKTVISHCMGDTVPNIVVFFKYCALFHVDPAWLYGERKGSEKIDGVI